MAARVPRQERGEQRRDALLAAAVRVVTAGGPAAFSARSVATKAGLPLAAVSYYFPRLDDLLGAAIAVVVQGWVDHAEAIVAALERSANRVSGTRIGGMRAGAEQGNAEQAGAERAADAITHALLPRGGPVPIRRRYEQLLAAASYPVAAAALAELRPRLCLLVERILLGTGTASIIGADGLIALLDGAAVGAISENAAGCEKSAEDGDLRVLIASTLRLALTDQH